VQKNNVKHHPPIKSSSSMITHSHAQIVKQPIESLLASMIALTCMHQNVKQTHWVIFKHDHSHMHKNVKATSSFIFKGAPGLLTCSVSPRSYNPRQSHIHDPKVCRADKEWQHVQPCSPNYPIYPPTPLILQWQNLYLFLAKLFQVIYYLNNILF
jgi:hypothetical protein